jgi:hypothetical protein
MDVPWKVIFAFLGVFVAGAIFGGVFTIGVSARRMGAQPRQAQWVDRGPGALSGAGGATAVSSGPTSAPVAAPRPNPITVQLMTQFTRRLSPTPGQREELRRILGRAGEDLQRLRQENLADVTRVTERMYADIAGVLTLEQRSELEKMRRQFEERVLADRKKREEAAAAEKAEKAEKAGKAAPTVRPPSSAPKAP